MKELLFILIRGIVKKGSCGDVSVGLTSYQSGARRLLPESPYPGPSLVY